MNFDLVFNELKRGVIFLQLILDNFGDNHSSPFVIGQKQWREKE